MIDGYEISTEKADMDVDAIYAYLSVSYWAEGISKEVVKTSIENSLCFGLFYHDKQVGFARLITDRATFAYLADVYVLEQHRGKGLSKWLMHQIVAHDQLKGVRRLMLATRDAHGLYDQFGFKMLADPTMFMERWNPNAYRNNG